MTTPVAGWYPDPSGQAGERFWNGTGWTQQTRPTPAVPTAVPAEAPQAYDGFGNPAAPVTPTPPPGQQAPAYGSTPPPYGGAQPYGAPPQQPYGSPLPFATGQYGAQYGGQPTPGRPPSFWARNTLSLATIGVTLLYVLILVFAHFAILGILPLLLGVRAVGRKEPLAVAAVVIGIAALVLSIYEFSR